MSHHNLRINNYDCLRILLYPVYYSSPSCLVLVLQLLKVEISVVSTTCPKIKKSPSYSDGCLGAC